MTMTSGLQVPSSPFCAGSSSIKRVARELESSQLLAAGSVLRRLSRQSRTGLWSFAETNSRVDKNSKLCFLFLSLGPAQNSAEASFNISLASIPCKLLGFPSSHHFLAWEAEVRRAWRCLVLRQVDGGWRSRSIPFQSRLHSRI